MWSQIQLGCELCSCFLQTETFSSEESPKSLRKLHSSEILESYKIDKVPSPMLYKH